ncbi:hypothetical protein IFM89_034629 [Coptis chinensis]|uniref:CW-type domain-containing protein n=1 Tax=Coptis chinensis TaxID=261450 RepID=A0A835HX83_9MAGN|nr:hypothetical protein IFM89_034629 [Coptis chinensis]
MISIGSRRDGSRKGIGGLGFEMEETELEEGEAFDNDHIDDVDVDVDVDVDIDDDDDDNDVEASIDPDVDLSYLDEKVQVLLGHCQKDFEGGVSAENLGAKYGGYGSFLPTYQRSPSVWTQPRTPQTVQSHGTPRSPNNLLTEGDQNSVVPSGATSFLKNEPASSSAAPPPVSKAPFLESSSKRESSLVSGMSNGEYKLKNEPPKKLNNFTDQKTLKVRLKVGSDNMALKTAAIFNDLGFPPSSPEDSPVESGGLSPESRESPDESPTSILQIMTSSPVPDGLVLSPLPDSLLHLAEKEKLGRPGLDDGHLSACMLVDQSSSMMGEGRVLEEKKMKPVENSIRSIDRKNGIVKDENGISALLNKEIDIETPEGRELVADSLKLPILSNSKISIGDTANGAGRASEVSGEPKKLKVKNRFISPDLVKEDPESIACLDVNTIEKLKLRTVSGDKNWEDRKEKVSKDISSISRSDGKSKGNQNYDSCKVEFDGSTRRKELNGGIIGPPENKVKLRAASLEQDGGRLPYEMEQTLSTGKKKSKGSKTSGNSATEFPKESLRVVSSAASKDRKKSNSDSSSKNKLDDNKLRREFGKTRETYRDIFGDTDLEQAENSTNSVETSFKDRSKDYKLDLMGKETRQSVDRPKDRSSGKEIDQFADKPKERPNGKKVETPATSVAYTNEAQIVAPSIGTELVSNTVSAVAAPTVINENWVCCDRCQKWRLLPFGKNPDDLTKKKWLCSMLDWLPGMNRCSFSEEETTKALNALLYHIPAPESQNLQSQTNGAADGVIVAEAHHLDLKQQDHNLLAVPSGGKKQHGLKETADSTSFMGPMHFSNSTNKSQQASMKSRSINDVNLSPSNSNLAKKAGNQHSSKSSDSAAEKRRHKQKDKSKLAQDGGVVNNSKIKNERPANQDELRASKKFKSENFNNAEEEWNLMHGVVMGNSGPTSASLSSAKASMKGMKKHGECLSSKEAKLDTKDNLPCSTKKPKDLDRVSLDVAVADTRKLDTRDMGARKRKANEYQESQVFPSEALADAGHLLEVNRVSLEGIQDHAFKKGKKAKVSNSEGKESSKSVGAVSMDRRYRSSQILDSSDRDFVADDMEEGKSYVDKDHQPEQCEGGNMVSQQMFDSVDPLKRDLGYGLPTLAATSSSSKVSGSRRSKANFREAKGSPVESVSSSPLRTSEKGTSTGRILLGKDDAPNVGFTVTGSLRRCSDGEGDGGSGLSGSGRKEKAHLFVHRGSMESTVPDYQDREVHCTPVDKAKAHTAEHSCVEVGNHHCMNGSAETFDHRVQLAELPGKEHGHDNERVDKHHGSNGSLSRKSGKGSSLRSKDKHKGSKYDLDKGKIKVSGSVNDQEELCPIKNSRNVEEIERKDPSLYHEEPRGGKNGQERHGVKGGKDDKSYSRKNEYIGKWSSEGRRENQSKFSGNNGTDVKVGATCSKDGHSNAQQNFMQDRVAERSSHRSFSDKPDQFEAAFGRGKSQSIPHAGDKQDFRSMSSNHKANGSDMLPVDASSGGGGADEFKVAKQLRKPDSQTGTFNNSFRHSTPGRVIVGDLDGPSPVKKDSSSQAANAALKEAKDLKHSADRVKSNGSDLESTGLYFEAVLKFLHGASMLEPLHVESSRHFESQSMHIYSTTVSLCEFVAHEYERCKEMAAAALAHKCVEVSYMRVVYLKNFSANKDRLVLQASLQMVPPGESPSSSASDVDNLNNQGNPDKVALAKGVGSPHVAGDHVIAARNRPSFLRLLNFTQDVNSAMEASRKAQNAFAVASTSLEESRYEGISSVKRVLDFNFHDVQGLLRLVRLAMEAISR